MAYYTTACVVAFRLSVFIGLCDCNVCELSNKSAAKKMKLVDPFATRHPHFFRQIYILAFFKVDTRQTIHGYNVSNQSAASGEHFFFQHEFQYF